MVTVNGDEIEVPEGLSLEGLLHRLGLGGKWVLVERNGRPVPRADLTTTILTAGDRLELVRAVAGG